MLFQKKKSILITFTSLIMTSISIGGVASAQEYRYPPQNVQHQPQSPAAVQTARPAQPRQPVRVAPTGYPRPYAAPYPGQRNFAPGPSPYGQAPYGRPYAGPTPYGQAPYSRPYAGPAPYGQAPYSRSNAGSSPYGQAPYSRQNAGPSPYGQAPYGRPYNRGSNNSGPFNSGPFSGSPFGNNPMDNFGFGPFNRDTAPWETWPFGGRDSLWNRKELPFKNRNPGDWLDPADPKEGLAIMWEDLISAPDDLGEMPGGWYVPSISTPNPVDLEDQLEKASKEIPDLIRIYN